MVISHGVGWGRGGGGYSEFRLIHRLGLFFFCFVFLVFRILNFTIFLGLGEKVVIFLGYWSFADTGVTFKTVYFLGSIKVLGTLRVL